MDPLISAGGGTGGPTVPSISTNWSGYVVLGKQFNEVSDVFTEPTITCTGFGQTDSEWVGLDGVTNQTVEQDGTGAACGGPGYLTPLYYAWYEMYPEAAVTVFPVKAGDVISDSVKYNAGNYTLTISDITSGASYTDVATCASCQRSSAEWVNERPAWCNPSGTSCALSALADFSQSTMADAVAGTGSGAPMPIGSYPENYVIDMVNPLSSGGFVSLDTTGPLLGPLGNAFTVTWDRVGTPLKIAL